MFFIHLVLECTISFEEPANAYADHLPRPEQVRSRSFRNRKMAAVEVQRE